MVNETTDSTQNQLEDVADNAGARTAAINNNPEISLQEAKNAAAGEGPNASGSTVPSSTEWHIPSPSEPYATNIPTANAPSDAEESTDETISQSATKDE